jgi:hypothetical protein
MTSKFIAAALLALAVWQPSNACSIVGLGHEVNFPPESSTLQSSEVRALANWYVNLRDGPFGIAEARVYAYSVKGSPHSARLTHERAAAVATLMKMLGSTSPVPLFVDVKDARNAAPQMQQVFIAAQPACAKSVSCCPGMP